jgi:hypothetical protein
MARHNQKFLARTSPPGQARCLLFRDGHEAVPVDDHLLDPGIISSL